MKDLNMNFAPTKNKISSAVILGGGYNAMFGPLTRHSHIFMLPVLNRPFIEYTIESLKDKGINNIIISSSREYSIKEGEWLKGIRHKFGPDFKIQYVTDNRPRGTAGALSDLKDFISKGCFLVLSGNIYLGDVDLDDMLTSDIARKSVITVGVKKDERLSVGGIFIFVGINPTTDFVDVEKDEHGFIKNDQDIETSVKGIFAAGDCRITPLKQVTTAVGDGAIAAFMAEKYIEGLD